MKEEIIDNIPFRLVTYRDRDEGQGPLVGLVFEETIVSLAALARYHPAANELAFTVATSVLTPGVQGLLTEWEKHFDMLHEIALFVQREGPMDLRWSKSPLAVHVLAPVLRPEKMLYAASNYEEHIREAENWKASGLSNFKGIDKAVTRPYSFIKLPSCIIGPYDPIVFPRGFEQLDYEIELALVIGRRGKHILVERAMDYVAGFMVANDVSLRDLTVRQDWPFLRSDWFAGKNFDTSAPLGPYLVPRAFIKDHLNLRLLLSVNGAVRQDSLTRYMIFTPEEQIAFISSFITLEPGDIIATGTPSGVGFRTGEYLKVGDVIEAEIEGLGRQRSQILADQEAS